MLNLKPIKLDPLKFHFTDGSIFEVPNIFYIAILFIMYALGYFFGSTIFTIRSFINVILSFIYILGIFFAVRYICYKGLSLSKELYNIFKEMFDLK